MEKYNSPEEKHEQLRSKLLSQFVPHNKMQSQMLDSFLVLADWQIENQNTGIPAPGLFNQLVAMMIAHPIDAEEFLTILLDIHMKMGLAADDSFQWIEELANSVYDDKNARKAIDYMAALSTMLEEENHRDFERAMGGEAAVMHDDMLPEDVLERFAKLRQEIEDDEARWGTQKSFELGKKKDIKGEQ